MWLSKWRTIVRQCSIVFRSYFLNRDERALHAHFAEQDCESAVNAPARILIEAPEDYFYLSLFGAIASSLAKKHPLRVDQFILRSLRHGSSRSARSLFWSVASSNILTDLKWKRLYGSFARGFAWRATAHCSPLKELKFWLQAWCLFHGLRDLDSLLALKIRGIAVGDLVADSYIRFKPAPEVALNDAYLLVVIRQAIKDVNNAINYFRRAKPHAYLTSYTTYIQHGIPARVALSLGVPTFSFGNYETLAKRISKDDWCHTQNGARYKSDFLSLEYQTRKLEVAENGLAALTEGSGGNPAYFKDKVTDFDEGLKLRVKDMPVIFLHNFFDSIHCYRWITFPDFWTWVCFTIEAFQRSGIPFAVKPHPLQDVESRGVVERLVRKYPNLNWIPAQTNNRLLVEAGMSCAVTLYGTVAAEMAFFGVPSISCGDNPHIAFDFSNTARTVVEYESLLQNSNSLPRNVAELKQESCIFYYMHNLNFSDQELAICAQSAVLRELIYCDPMPSAETIIDAISIFIARPEFEVFVLELSWVTSGGWRKSDRTGKTSFQALRGSTSVSNVLI
jgi:hypothetical protein